LLAFACARGGGSSHAGATEVVVFAASSLRDGFEALRERFEREHPGVHVAFNFAGTQQLCTQLEHGARADVLASADQWHMDALVRSGLVRDAVVFAHNEPVIVLSRETESVHGLGDLPALERIVVGDSAVPIGRYTRQVLERAEARFGPGFRERVEARVVSRELDVKQVLAKVLLGEAQAGIVYRSDARTAAKQVRAVTIAPELNVVATYPIAVTSNAAHSDLATAWVRFVVSPQGQATLARFGFSPVVPAKGTP
jgi:molybdate transport system substrate-binding protein